MYFGKDIRSAIGTATESEELAEAPGSNRQYVVLFCMLQAKQFTSEGTIQLKGGTDLLAHIHITENGMGYLEEGASYFIPAGNNKALNLVVPNGVDEVLYTVRYVEAEYPLD